MERGKKLAGYVPCVVCKDFLVHRQLSLAGWHTKSQCRPWYHGRCNGSDVVSQVRMRLFRLSGNSELYVSIALVKFPTDHYSTKNNRSPSPKAQPCRWTRVRTVIPQRRGAREATMVILLRWMEYGLYSREGDAVRRGACRTFFGRVIFAQKRTIDSSVKVKHLYLTRTWYLAVAVVLKSDNKQKRGGFEEYFLGGG